MYCKNCGEKIQENAKFCVFCGTKIDSVIVEEEKEEIVIEDTIDIFKQEEIEEENDFKNLDEMENLDNSVDIEKSENIEEDIIEVETEKLPEELCNFENVDIEEAKEECGEIQENSETIENTTEKVKGIVIEEIISLVFGVTSLILSIFINVFSLPMSASGLVFGSYGKSKSGNHVSVGKCINIVSMIISLFMFFVCVCGFLGMMSDISANFIKPEPFNYQYNLNTNINEEEDKQAEKDFQKAQDMLNKQLENKRKMEEEKETAKKEISKSEGRKYTNIGFMEYTIPDSWNFNGIRESGGNSVANVFSKNDDTVFLAIKSMDLTNAQFSKEMLTTEVTQMYGGITEEGAFTTNNGITWDYIKTPIYDGENMKYSNNIYYHLTEDGNALLYFEIYIPDNGTTEELMKDIDTILNSVKKHK